MNFLLAMILTTAAYAQQYDLKPHYLSAENTINVETSGSLRTKESLIEINGEKFREIELRNEKYYIRFRNSEKSLQDDPDCLKQSNSTNEKIEPFRVVGKAELSSRTTAFIEGLRVKCQKITNPLDLNAGISHRKRDGSTIGIVANPVDQQIGISLKDKEDRERKLLLAPGGLGAGATW